MSWEDSEIQRRLGAPLPVLATLFQSLEVAYLGDKWEDDLLQ